VTEVKTDEKNGRVCIKVAFSQKLKKTGDKVMEMRARQPLLSFFGWSFSRLASSAHPNLQEMYLNFASKDIPEAMVTLNAAIKSLK
jgi:hypothetical protein